MTDRISLGVLASAVPRDAVDEAIEATGMAYFAMALALFR